MYLLIVFLSFSQKIFSLATLARLRFILNLQIASIQCVLPTPFIYFFTFGVNIPDCQLPKFTVNTHKIAQINCV